MTTPKTYISHLDVRGYELDSFGHVNHAVYVSYLEHARWDLLTEEGITLEKFNAWKCWPVIAGIELRYLKPTFLGDRLRIETRVIEHGRSHFTFAQTIFRESEEVLRAKVQAVMVNEKGRPVQTPAEVTRIWKERNEA